MEEAFGVGGIVQQGTFLTQGFFYPNAPS